jgi:hypothetical protein
MNNRDKYIELIESNIKACGYHVYIVKSDGSLPRFGYTIGLSKTIGYELILAGALLYSDEEVKIVLDEIHTILKDNSSLDKVDTLLGQFMIKSVDESWIKELMLGALDYYDVETIPTLQLVPMGEYKTIDIPDLSKQFNVVEEPIWKYLVEEWSYPVPVSSICVTDLDTLRGKPLIQAIRWEEDYWEAFSELSSEKTEENTRFVPLNIVMGSYESHNILLELSMNEGAIRNDTIEEWEIWEIKN